MTISISGLLVCAGTVGGVGGTPQSHNPLPLINIGIFLNKERIPCNLYRIVVQ